MVKKVILAVDQSYTSTGYCILVDGNLMESGILTSDKKLDIFERSWHMTQDILELADFWKVDSVVLEGLAFGMRGSATRDLAGLQFVIVTYLRFNGSHTVNVIAPLTVKKYATGSGKAKKQDMFDSLPQKIKENFVDEKGYKKTKGLYDVVDSYWIGQTAINLYEQGKL